MYTDLSEERPAFPLQCGWAVGRVPAAPGRSRSGLAFTEPVWAVCDATPGGCLVGSAGGFVSIFLLTNEERLSVYLLAIFQCVCSWPGPPFQVRLFVLLSYENF